MELLALAVIIAAIILAVGIGLASRRIVVAAAGIMAALSVQTHLPPSADSVLDEFDHETREWNWHLPYWSAEEETSFGEAFVYQIAMLAQAHSRLAAVMERLSPPPAKDTNSGVAP